MIFYLWHESDQQFGDQLIACAVGQLIDDHTVYTRGVFGGSCSSGLAPGLIHPGVHPSSPTQSNVSNVKPFQPFQPLTPNGFQKQHHPIMLLNYETVVTVYPMGECTSESAMFSMKCRVIPPCVTLLERSAPVIILNTYHNCRHDV